MIVGAVSAVAAVVNEKEVVSLMPAYELFDGSSYAVVSSWT